MPKFDLILDRPLMNAAGALGFAPDERGPVDLADLGAFLTNPISLAPRTPAHDRGVAAYPGGFLLHSGYPNPGLSGAIRQYAPRWARAVLPVWVHLLVEGPEDVAAMVPRLEGREGVSALELGLPPLADAESARAIVQAAVGELPVVARLPLDRAVELAPALADLPVSAVSLGPPRGALPGAQEALTSGRLYGPGVFPQALAAVQWLVEMGSPPVIGAGGVYRREQVETMLAAGAVGVQLDAVLWRAGI
jgi:dihydroorotate dehydrogenase (NAD+) catalytic subunit